MPKSKAGQARDWVDANTAAAVAIVMAAALVPGAASIVLTTQEANMAYHIGKIYKADFDSHDAQLLAGAIGLACVAGPLIALEAAILAGPGAFLIKPVIAAGIIKAMGEAIIAHCEGKYNIRTQLKIINVETGKCLDIRDDGTSNGSIIHQWDYHGGNNQKWVIDHGTKDCVRIDSVHCDKSIDIPERITSGGHLHIWDYWGGDNQNFRLVQNANGSYIIYCFFTDFVLSVPEGANGNGVPIIAQQFKGNKSQEWWVHLA